MRNLLILLAAIMALGGSCDRITVGYLETAHAEYAPDTAVWKAVLDPALPEDARQLELGIPFSSAEIQGVQGTSPVVYSISRVECGSGGGGSCPAVPHGREPHSVTCATYRPAGQVCFQHRGGQ